MHAPVRMSVCFESLWTAEGLSCRFSLLLSHFIVFLLISVKVGVSLVCSIQISSPYKRWLMSLWPEAEGDELFCSHLHALAAQTFE